MSLTKLQRSLGKCADELADVMDGFEKLHDQLRSYRKSMVLNIAAPDKEATIEFNACAVPRDDQQVSFLQRSDSSAAVDYGQLSSHAGAE